MYTYSKLTVTCHHNHLHPVKKTRSPSFPVKQKMYSMLKSPRTTSNTSYVTPDTTPDKIAAKPLTDHTNDLRTVRNTNAKRRITFAANVDGEDEDDTDDNTSRQLWLDQKLLMESAENEDVVIKSAKDFFITTDGNDQMTEVAEVVKTEPFDADNTKSAEVAEVVKTESFDADNTKSSEVTEITEITEVTEIIESHHDSPVRHCAKSWREIVEDDEENDETSDDEPCAKKVKAEHFVSCRNCERTYDGLAQCCPQMDHVHEDFEDSEGRD
jgi:hypothetical protein